MTERIGHYTILSELGRGGMGVVYKAHEESLNRFVAIKVLGEHLAADPSYVQRFLREAQSAARLNHPNIVQIHLVGEDQGRHYFVMEYVHGSSLQQLLQRRGSLSVQEGARLVLQAAAGLAAAHDHGVIHRDVKPANLLIDERGLVKIADFGLALMREAMSRLTATGMFMGTPGYLAPEQCMEEEVDLRADIYSLGVTLFEILTGRTPFTASSPLALLRQIIEAEPPDVCQLNPQVDQGTRDILLRMLAKDRSQRFATCHELIATLQPHLDRLVAAGMGFDQQGAAAVVAAPLTPLSAPRPAMEQGPTLAAAAAVSPLTPPPLPLVPPVATAAAQPASSSAGRGAGIALAAVLLLAVVVLGATAAYLLLNRHTEQPPQVVASSASPTPSAAVGLWHDSGGEAQEDGPSDYGATAQEIVDVQESVIMPTATLARPTSAPLPTAAPPLPVTTSRPTASPTPRLFATPPAGAEAPTAPSPAAAATTIADPLADLATSLRSGNGQDEQLAAKRLYRSHRLQAQAHEIAATALLAGFNSSLDDGAHVDAMAWLTNVLGASNNAEYIPTLEHVAAEAESRKIRRFAEKNLKLLR